jgi:hypothetical protein
MGGKPNSGTKKDRRLKANKPKPSPKKGGKMSSVPIHPVDGCTSVRGGV